MNIKRLTISTGLFLCIGLSTWGIKKNNSNISNKHSTIIYKDSNDYSKYPVSFLDYYENNLINNEKILNNTISVLNDITYNLSDSEIELSEKIIKSVNNPVLLYENEYKYQDEFKNYLYNHIEEIANYNFNKYNDFYIKNGIYSKDNIKNVILLLNNLTNELNEDEINKSLMLIDKITSQDYVLNNNEYEIPKCSEMIINKHDNKNDYLLLEKIENIISDVNNLNDGNIDDIKSNIDIEINNIIYRGNIDLDYNKENSSISYAITSNVACLLRLYRSIDNDKIYAFGIEKDSKTGGIEKVKISLTKEEQDIVNKGIEDNKDGCFDICSYLDMEAVLYTLPARIYEEDKEFWKHKIKNDKNEKMYVYK